MSAFDPRKAFDEHGQDDTLEARLVFVTGVEAYKEWLLQQEPVAWMATLEGATLQTTFVRDQVGVWLEKGWDVVSLIRLDIVKEQPHG